MDQMPLEEHPSGSIVGVGSLPGTIEESGVAILPDERVQMGLPSLTASMTRKVLKKKKPMGTHEQEIMKDEATPGQDSGRGQEWIKSLGMERKAGMKAGGREHEEGPQYSRHEKIIRYFQKVDREWCLVSVIVYPVHKHFSDHVMLKVDLPSQEEPSGSYAGVGSLPGPRHEAGVALLPEERKYHLDNGTLVLCSVIDMRS